MNFEELVIKLKDRFGESVILEEEHIGLQPAIFINKDMLIEVCMYLRDTETLYFDFLNNITAVDFETHFTIVYHLTSIPYQHRLVLKVKLEGSRDLDQLPEIPSITSVWRTADWHEREAFDLMGIFFIDHPDLRRILLPDDWAGYPLRKDYKEAELYKGIPLN